MTYEGTWRDRAAGRPRVARTRPGPEEELALPPSIRSEFFRDWNPGESDEAPRKPSEMTRNWPPRRPATAGPWDETRDLGPDGRDEGFRLDVGLDRALLGALDRAAAVTVGRPGEGAGEGETGEHPAKQGPIDFPARGDGIGGFRLIAELGRGAFGRVFLAEESGLGNRPVALKITRAEGDEPRLLARLQHTNIVPIHSVVDDPKTGLRLMCMPYFGGANLAEVLGAAGASSPTEGAGRSLVEALDLIGHPAPSEARSLKSLKSLRSFQPFPTDWARPAGHDSAMSGSSVPLKSLLGRIPWWSRSISSPPRPRVKAVPPDPDDRDPMQPARRFLRRASFVRATVWIAARLAEGLEHAHSRGLLHRDLKPSNILIAADGTPMLLDFNLAADATGSEQGDKAMMGGTLPYMAPEHLDAFNPKGSTPPEAVDERADIYALALILFEMLAGRHPFESPEVGRPILEVLAAMTEERRGPAPSARAFNPGVTPGLDAILRKALDPDPALRHARAGDLAEDLRRYLDDLPLKYAPEPSLRERAEKWARRNPRATGASSIGVLALFLIVAVAGASWTLSHHLRQVSARLRMKVFEDRFRQCQFLLNTSGGPADSLERGIALAEGTLVEAGVESSGKGRLAASWFDALPAEERDEVRRDLAELMLLDARARVVRAEGSRSEPRRKAALHAAIHRLDRAEALDPEPTQALFEDRARYRSALGDAAGAGLDLARRDATPPATGRDFYLLGTSLLARNRPDQAETPLLRAVSLDPRRFWSWFSLGLCHFDQQRYAESAGDFAVCAVLAPKFAWPWMNRGLALARAGRLVEARQAYNRALEIEPDSPESRVNRGLTALELGEPEAAVPDLKRAVALGRSEGPVRSALAEALAKTGHRDEALAILAGLIAADPAAPFPRIARGTLLARDAPKAAEADFRAILARDPRHAAAHLGLARLLRQADPRDALAEADLAVVGDPGRLEALELRALLRARLGDPLAAGDVERLVQSPTPHRLFNAACALALLDEARPDPALAPRAIDLLRRALDLRFPPDQVRGDPDLRSLEARPDFRSLGLPTKTFPNKP